MNNMIPSTSPALDERAANGTSQNKAAPIFDDHKAAVADRQTGDTSVPSSGKRLQDLPPEIRRQIWIAVKALGLHTCEEKQQVVLSHFRAAPAIMDQYGPDLFGESTDDQVEVDDEYSRAAKCRHHVLPVNQTTFCNIRDCHFKYITRASTTLIPIMLSCRQFLKEARDVLYDDVLFIFRWPCLHHQPDVVPSSLPMEYVREARVELEALHTVVPVFKQFLERANQGLGLRLFKVVLDTVALEKFEQTFKEAGFDVRSFTVMGGKKSENVAALREMWPEIRAPGKVLLEGFGGELDEAEDARLRKMARK